MKNLFKAIVKKIKNSQKPVIQYLSFTTNPVVTDITKPHVIVVDSEGVPKALPFEVKGKVNHKNFNKELYERAEGLAAFGNTKLLSLHWGS